MQYGESKLISVPPLIDFESPSSWVTRAALSQGITYVAFAKYLGLSPSLDMDLQIDQITAQRIADICGFNVHHFWLVCRMFDRLKKFDPAGETLLLRKHREKSRSKSIYRYCPVCLHEQKTKHFPLHWRFKAWYHCPIHKCMMENRCLHCGSEVQLCCNLIEAGPKKQGIAFLNRCQFCEGDLTSESTKIRGLISQSILTKKEQEVIKESRLILGAIYKGYYRFFNGPKIYNLEDLKCSQRNFDSLNFDRRLTNQELMRRKQHYGESFAGLSLPSNTPEYFENNH